jgi:hypothetical protein
MLYVALPGGHLRLENDLFQNCFQVTRSLCLSILAQLLQHVRQPRKTDLIIHAQECQPPLFSEMYLEAQPLLDTQKGRYIRVRLFHRPSATQAASTFGPCPLAPLWCVTVMG